MMKNLGLPAITILSMLSAAIIGALTTFVLITFFTPAGWMNPVIALSVVASVVVTSRALLNNE